MVGDYGNAPIIVRNTTNQYKTGVLDENHVLISENEVSTLNGSKGIEIVSVLAWSTRIYFIEVVSIDNTTLPRINSR
jgi:hypothetical protein